MRQCPLVASLILGLLSLLIGNIKVNAQTLNWTGAGDGVSFGSPSNWSPAVSPGPTHDCIIPAGGSQSIVPKASTNIRSLTTGRNFNFSGCDQMTVTAGIALTDGAIIRIDNGGGCAGITFDGGVQSVTGNGQIIVIDEGNSGHMLALTNGAQVTIASGITVSFSPTVASKSTYINIQSACSLTNLGLLAVNHPSATLNVIGAGTFVNSGTVRAASGKLSIANISGDIGTLVLNSGATISLSGNYSVSAPVNVPSSATLTLAGTWASTAPLWATDSTVNFAGTWSHTGGTLLGSAVWNLSGTYSSLGDVTRVGGVVTLSGTYTSPTLTANASTGNLTLSGLSLDGTTLTSSDGAFFSLGNTSNFNACTLDAELRISCGTASITGGLNLTSKGRLFVAPTCSPAVVAFAGGVQSVSGSGVIDIRAANVGVQFKQSATVTFGSGLTFNAGTDSSGSSGTIAIEAGSTFINFTPISVKLQFNLTISGDGNFESRAPISVGPAGRLTIEPASWVNAAPISATDATIILRGAFNSLGSLTRTGGSLTIGGTFFGPLLEATDATGDILLSSLTASNTVLSALPGRKLTSIGGLNLNACTLATDLLVPGCPETLITGGLTLANASTLTIGDTSSCSPYGGLVFSGGPQIVGGSGTLLLRRGTLSSLPALRLKNSADVSIGPGVTVEAGISGNVSYITIDAGSTLTNLGTFLANNRLVISGEGTFRNQGLFEVANLVSSINTANWSNTGTFRVLAGATLDLAGTFSSLGTIDRQGGTIVLNGTFNGPVLEVTSGTGDLTLGSATLQNATLAASGGAKFTVTGDLVLDGCAIDAQLQLVTCGNVNIRNGLTFFPGGSLVIDYKGISSNCSAFYAVTFTGTQNIQGSGDFVVNESNNQAAFRVAENSFVTFASGVTLRFGPDSNGTKFSSGLSISPGATLHNEGTIAVRQAGRAFAISSSDAAASFTNAGTVECTAGTLTLYTIPWTNLGQFLLSDTGTLKLGGAYSALGTINRSGGTLVLSGTYTGAALTADASTGDLELSGIVIKNSSLSLTPGFSITSSDAVTLDNTPITTSFTFGKCARVVILKNLTILNDSVIRFNGTGSCVPAAPQLIFGSTTAQTITGSGQIRLNGCSLSTSALLTITPAITISAGLETPNQSCSMTANGSGSIKNQGLINADSGGQFVISGTFMNQGSVSALAGTLNISGLGGSTGNLFIGPDASLFLAGNYSISDPIAISGGGGLNLSGTWTNNSTISSDHANLVLGGTWTNAGTFAVSNSAWTIGGTYSSLGNSSSSNNALTYTGAFPGPVLEANASTGDITLSTITLNNTVLRARDEARFKVGLGAAITLSQCAIETDLHFTFCSTISVNKGLTLADGVTLTFDNPFCNRPAITFTGATQSISGRAKIAILDAGSANAITNSSSTGSVVTIDQDIELTFGPTPAGAGAPLNNFAVSVGSGRTLLNLGVITSRIPGKSVLISTGTFQNAGTIESAAGAVSITSSLSNYNSAASRLTGGRWIMSGGSLTIGSGAVNSIGPDTEFRISGPAGTTPNFAALSHNAGTLALVSRSLAATPSGGPFLNVGTLELGAGAHLQLNGSAAFDPASTLRIPIAGLHAESHGRLTASGSISLAGKLSASFVAPYVPIAGDTTSPILSAPILSGTFVSACADANPAMLGVQPLLDSGSAPNTLSLLVAPSSGLTPLITQQPIDTNAAPNASFTCAASPSDASYRWFKSGSPLQDGPTGHGSSISGALSPFLTVFGVTATDSGLYTCAATNSCGTTLSDPARLSICPGDFNADGLVDDSDFQLFAASYNLLDCSDPAMPPSCPADLDRSGAVDDADFPIFILSYDALICP